MSTDKKRLGGLGAQTAAQFAEAKMKEIKEEVGDKKVLCGLSGGVDSSVCAVLVHKAIGDNLTCVFVDHGLLRKGEADQVEELFGRQFKMKLICVDARRRFLDKLAGVTDPEKKRKIIGEEFIRVFEDEAKKLEASEGKIDYLLQGTIYPDVLESGEDGAELVKSHHNVGGLPEGMSFSLLEPVRMLYKDEVRAVGEALGLSREVVWRQPFPGPGIGVRCIGEITEEKLSLIREADAIVREEIKLAGLESEVWQYFAVLPNVQSTGARNGKRTYEHLIGIRAITSTDVMTANWAKLPHEVLEKMSDRIMNEVPGINRVVYDITKKPHGTVEWE